MADDPAQILEARVVKLELALAEAHREPTGPEIDAALNIWDKLYKMPFEIRMSAALSAARKVKTGET